MSEFPSTSDAGFFPGGSGTVAATRLVATTAHGGSQKRGDVAQVTDLVAEGQDTDGLSVTGVDLNGGTIGVPEQTRFAATSAVGFTPSSVTAADINGGFMANHDTGVPLHDADARGGTPAIRVAILTNHADLTFQDTPFI